MTNVAVLDVESKRLVSRRLQKGDVIIERSGGGPKQPVGRVCYFDIDDERSHSFSNFTSTLRIKDRTKFSPLFVHYFLLSLYQDGFTESLQRATTGIRNLDFTAYQCAEVPQPIKPEQEKIAAVLWKVQRAIEVEEKLTATARELKQAAMRQLFTHGLRGEAQKETEIGPLPESWTVVQLGAHAKIGNGTTPNRQNAAYWQGGTVPWITSGRMYERRITGSETYVTNKALDEASLPILQPGAILMAIVGQGKTLGHCAILDVVATVSRHVGFIQFHDGNISPEFVRGYLESQYEFLRQLAAGNGSTRAALTSAILRSFVVPLPTLPEQHDIIAILDTLDRKIALHDRKRATMQELFQTLLHKLMTGEIRVTDLDIDVSEVTQ